MKENEPMKNQSLVVFGVLLVVFISVSAVIAYVYFQPPSNSISQREIYKEIARQESEVIDRKLAVVTEYVPSSDHIQDSKPEERSDKNAPAREVKANDQLYASVPDNSDHGNASSRPEREVKHLKNLMSWPSRPVQPSDLPRVKKSDSGVSRLPYNQTGLDSPFRDIIPDNSSDIGESVNNDPEDKTALTDKDKANSDDTVGRNDKYNVSVSRSINTGKVMLTVAINNNPPNGLIINENIPAGWQITSASTAPLNCRSYPCAGNMKWLFITQNVGNDITYTMEKISDSAGSSISGNYLFKDPAAGRMIVTTKGASGV